MEINHFPRPTSRVCQIQITFKPLNIFTNRANTFSSSNCIVYTFKTLRQRHQKERKTIKKVSFSTIHKPWSKKDTEILFLGLQTRTNEAKVLLWQWRWSIPGQGAGSRGWASHPVDLCFGDFSAVIWNVLTLFCIDKKLDSYLCIQKLCYHSRANFRHKI